MPTATTKTLTFFKTVHNIKGPKFIGVSGKVINPIMDHTNMP